MSPAQELQEQVQQLQELREQREQREQQQQREPLPRMGLVRSPSSTNSTAGMGSMTSSGSNRKEVDLYPLGRPFENMPTPMPTSMPTTAMTTTVMMASTTGAGGTDKDALTLASTLPPTPPVTGMPPSGMLSPSGSTRSTESAGSTGSTSSKSAYLQQRSQAALGSAKAWMKRSLEDRRVSEDDPLLAGME
ncbi:hypothetical protein BC939DRAFT_456018 [Gamsiella multidivaricata]|uniref:uncharacterized protein n=1 Tax=Gamsiella multidivaricata TaxID=101098 RepID=UPI00221FF226|nr:uncharacterized protein BC939DRAFT_456018 [Gamsiella multidivaricata]KAI7821183.1 hypothetical protein BC939DRAFT_456018 [Gamsiella multidivaricata]